MFAHLLHCTSGSRCFLRSAVVVAAALTLAAPCAAAAPSQEFDAAAKLARSGKPAEALRQVEAFLVSHPQDGQMRFLKGVLLAEQQKAGEAIVIFKRLTEQFPDLPEPYNNLAVLYAAQGDYEKAREALTQAIRTNPSYATAYENLGDIHAKLASQSYDRALALNQTNAGAKAKLTLLRTMPGNEKAGAPAAVPDKRVATAAQPGPAAPAPGKTAPVASAQPAPAPGKAAPVASAQPAPAPGKTAPVALAQPAPAPGKTAPVAAAQPAPAAGQTAAPATDTAVLATVQAWARAWAARDADAYLDFYSEDFAPPGGRSRAAWSKTRRERIVGKRNIDVSVLAPAVKWEDGAAVVRFRQKYRAGSLVSDTRKELTLVKRDGKWKIQREREAG